MHLDTYLCGLQQCPDALVVQFGTPPRAQLTQEWEFLTLFLSFYVQIMELL